MSEGRSASHPERTISVELRQGAHARADRGTGAAGCASGVIVDRTRPRDVLGFSVVAEGKFVSYLRVSTDKQGKSGLGIEAQRQAVERYLNGGRWTVAAEYVETESSRRSDRPKLAAALAHAKAIKAKLVFAKLLVPRTIAQPGRSKGRSNHTCQSRRRIKLPGWL